MPRFKHEAMCQHYTFTQNLFTTHTYLTFAFSLINTDGRNTAVDPRWGRVIHQTLPSLPSLAPPIQKGSGNQTSAQQGLGTSLPRPHPAHARRRGLVHGVTSRNAWASSRNAKRPMKSQSGVYWNNAEARTSTSFVPLKVML